MPEDREYKTFYILPLITQEKLCIKVQYFTETLRKLNAPIGHHGG